MKTVYLSGKITGADDYAERFGKAERELRQIGYAVINPVTIPGARDMSYDDVMKECLKRVETVDYLYMLCGWAWSPGAIAELRHFMSTHNRDENRVFYEIQGGMPNMQEGSCKSCLYHLPDAEDYRCVCDESPKYNDLTEDAESCDCYKERVSHGR